MSRCPAIVVHGGAGNGATIRSNPEYKESIGAAIRKATKLGWAILANGGSALDAVEAAVVALEDDYHFNAGTGSCLTRTGLIQMDAAIMDGTTLKAGAVTCISNIANPIRVARTVMEKSETVLLAGDYAKSFAIEHGFSEVPMESLLTDATKERLKTIQAEINSKPEGHDTVAAVAVDVQGNTAYANSTGGMQGKRDGRVGDSPLVGCGGYARSDVGATATTGKGEGFIRTCLGYHAIMLMQQGKSAQEALDDSMKYLASTKAGYGGMIAVDKEGDVGVSFDTEAMSWGYVKGNPKQLHWGIYEKEHFVEHL